MWFWMVFTGFWAILTYPIIIFPLIFNVNKARKAFRETANDLLQKKAKPEIYILPMLIVSLWLFNLMVLESKHQIGLDSKSVWFSGAISNRYETVFAFQDIESILIVKMGRSAVRLRIIARNGRIIESFNTSRKAVRSMQQLLLAKIKVINPNVRINCTNTDVSCVNP
ncbi:MAG: hypothetical protein RLZZ156_36 [Deinococcota bacterium]